MRISDWSSDVCSSDLLCQERAEREGWMIADSYADAAISGSSMILRPAVQKLLADAQAGKFDIVVAEALDRVSRDQVDVATFYKHRSEERRVGKECVSTCRSRWSPEH